MSQTAPARLTPFLALVLLSASAAAMDLGTNFWNLGWHQPGDCFSDFRAVKGEDPWNPQFLREIAIYRSLRFMDWDNTNHSPRENWSQRPQKQAARQNPVAYEWMIDLCNRTGADLWITIPHRTISRQTGDAPCDYALRLCLLVKTGVDMGTIDLQPLRDRLAALSADELVAAGGVRTGPPLAPQLKLYLEYSNETWNGQFQQAQHCAAEGEALGLDANPRTAGLRFHAWAALRMFRAAELVFGPGSPRLIKVDAAQSASRFVAEQHRVVYADRRWNPWKIQPTVLAIAPYFGHKVDGAADDAVAQLRAAIEKSASDAAKHRELARAQGWQLIAYEGGQHVITRAQRINRDPVMRDLYAEYLQAVSPYLTHFCHYAHVGQAGERGAWGSLEFTGQPLAEAPKYRALVEWAARQPQREGTADR